MLRKTSLNYNKNIGFDVFDVGLLKPPKKYKTPEMTLMTVTF